jgi:coenzyme PQQ precursor peptide PqqA
MDFLTSASSFGLWSLGVEKLAKYSSNSSGLTERKRRRLALGSVWPYDIFTAAIVPRLGSSLMAWKCPKIVEVPVGMEINMYACAARK